jgi:hypothetical protein
MAVMGGGDIIVGNESPTRKPARTIVSDQTGRVVVAGRKADDQTKICGAMAQQRDDSGGWSTPQKFVHLVGCRDPRLRPAGKR